MLASFIAASSGDRPLDLLGVRLVWREKGRRQEGRRVEVTGMGRRRGIWTSKHS